MSSSSSPIELTILSVKPQDSHVHHAASHVYVLEKKKQKKNKRKMKKPSFFFFTLSFNLVKVQDCCLLKFKDILGYISAYHLIPALTGFYFIGRIRFLTSVAFFFLIFNWECAIRLLSLRKFYFCLPCILTHSTSVVIRHFILFIYLFYYFFPGGGAILGFSLANLEVRLPKVKFFLKIKSHKSSFFI